MQVIQKLKQKDRYAFFQDPVDLTDYPDYAEKVPHPVIDFSVIDRRYRASERILDQPSRPDQDPDGLLYMGVSATSGQDKGVAHIKYGRLLRDITHIVENARAFNPPDTEKGTV